MKKLIFGNDDSRKKFQRIHELARFPFQIKTSEYEENILLIKNDYSINELNTFYSVLCGNNERCRLTK